MLKTVLITVGKRYWGVIASALVTSALLQYRQAHAVSPVALGLTLLVTLAALLVTAVPLECHKLRKRPRA
jgi:hypothetical protein